MKTITPSPMPNVSRMSGASTWSVALSSSSNDDSRTSSTNVNIPPVRTPSRSDSRAPPTPGRRSSANSTSRSEDAAACRSASASSTAAARPAVRASGSFADTPLPLGPRRPLGDAPEDAGR
jgi:hypothetical protein